LPCVSQPFLSQGDGALLWCAAGGDRTSWSWYHLLSDPPAMCMQPPALRCPSSHPGRKDCRSPLKLAALQVLHSFPAASDRSLPNHPQGTHSSRTQELPGCPAPRGPAPPRGAARRWLRARHPCGQSRGMCWGLCGFSLMGCPHRAGHKRGCAGISSWQRGWECLAMACSTAALPRQVTCCSGPLRA